MRHRCRGVLTACVVLSSALPLAAQDSLSARAAFPVDAARRAGLRSSYDMLAITGDSAQVIGRRTLEVIAATHAEQPVWLLIESRTGAVAAVESLYVTADLRPLRWSASQGSASLAMVFARDSVFGATGGPAGRQSVIAPVPPKLIVSTGMLELLLPLLPLSARWSDSVSVLAVNQTSLVAVPGELAVIGEDEGSGTWIIALRASAQAVLVWVTRETGSVVRIQQPVPLHIASLLEYRPMAPTPP